MAFMLYENATPSRATTPYLLDIQHDLCRLLGTRVVVPVVLEKPTQSSTDFVVAIQRNATVMYAITSHLAAVPLASLGAMVADCSEFYDVVRASVDRIFIGY